MFFLQYYSEQSDCTVISLVLSFVYIIIYNILLYVDIEVVSKLNRDILVENFGKIIGRLESMLKDQNRPNDQVLIYATVRHVCHFLCHKYIIKFNNFFENVKINKEKGYQFSDVLFGVLFNVLFYDYYCLTKLIKKFTAIN